MNYNMAMPHNTHITCVQDKLILCYGVENSTNAKSEVLTLDNVKWLDPKVHCASNISQYFQSKISNEIIDPRICFNYHSDYGYAPDLEQLGFELNFNGVNLVYDYLDNTYCKRSFLINFLRYGYIYTFENTLVNYIKSFPKPTHEVLCQILNSDTIFSAIEIFSKFNMSECGEIVDLLLNSSIRQFCNLKLVYNHIGVSYQCPDDIRKKIINLKLNSICSWAKII